jgi:glutamate racemase
MSAKVRVGMLDWGIGGLGVYRELKLVRPHLPVLYCSDTGATPYGRLSRPALRARVERLLGELERQGATHLLVACNAASTVLDAVEIESPLMGVIEAAVAAVPARMRGTLVVIGGARTVRCGLYRRALSRPDLRVISRIAQPLSAHIEAGTMRSPRFREDVSRILKGPAARADALLLACTHYPAISAQLRTVVSPHTQIIDPAPRLVADFVRRFGLRGGSGDDHFVTTGSPAAMRRAAQHAWGLTLPRCSRLAL